MDKDKEVEFLRALYMIQKASDLGDISLDKEPDKGIGPYEKAYKDGLRTKNEQRV